MSLWRRLLGIWDAMILKLFRTQDGEFGLRRNDPSPTYQNTLDKDLRFWGRILIEVEDVWNDDRTRGTRFDGEIYNRLAIYKKASGNRDKTYVGEQLRYNPRALCIYPEFSSLDDLPFMSLAEEFNQFDDVVDWIAAGPLITEGHLRDAFRRELERHKSGIARVDLPGRGRSRN